MLNSTQIIKELNLLIKDLITKYGANEQFALGLRFGEAVDKIPTRLDELVKTIWEIIDGKHEHCKEKYAKMILTSVFIQDKTGTLIYDSKVYKIGTDKIKLIKNSDSRVKDFKDLSPEDKSRLVDITISQIGGVSSDEVNKELPKSGWEDLPWIK